MYLSESESLKVELISCTKNPMKTVEEASSTCYQSESSLKIVNGCINSGHLSVTEHMNFTFKISGVSRAVLAQLTRHRIASYSVLSQRYVNMGEADFLVPYTISSNQEAYNKFVNISEQIKNIYNELIEMGIPQEDARSILPNACDTTIVMTMNLRSLANFMNERLCTRSQYAIRKMALAMKDEINRCKDFSLEELRVINKMLVPKCEKGSIYYCPEIKSCGKHKKLQEIMNDSESWREKYVALEEKFHKTLDSSESECENYNC